jgi:hypothetical protein
LKEIDGMQVPYGRRLGLFFERILGRKPHAVPNFFSHHPQPLIDFLDCLNNRYPG